MNNTTKESQASKADLNITRVVEDQNHNVWVKIRNGDKRRWISLSEFAKSSDYGFGALRSIGINVIAEPTKGHIKRQLERVRPSGHILVAARPGFIFSEEGTPIAYAYGNGKIIRPKGVKEPKIIVGFEAAKNFGRNGDPTVYQVEMGKLVRDQSLPILCLCLALAPIIQPFTPDGLYVENPILELCGSTSNYKSAVTIGCAGSVWGGTSDQNTKGKLGFFISGNGTINAIEESLQTFNNALMGIDETTASGEQKRGRAEALGWFIHRLSLGTPKARYREESRPPVRTIVIATSNAGFESICEESREVLDALLTRVISIHVPSRPTKIFDRLPEGYASVNDAGTAFYNIGMTNYGHVARAFIRYVLWQAANDYDQLRKAIGRRMKDIMKEVNYSSMDAAEQRRFKIIALAYAAGVTAKVGGALDKEHFGAFKEPLLRAWKSIAKPSKAQAQDRYMAFLQEHQAKVRVVHGKNLPELTDDEFNKTKAFICRTRDGRWLAAFPPKLMKSRFPGFEADFKRMREMGLARCNEHLQTKLRLRQRAEDRQDRCYAIYLERWPMA